MKKQLFICNACGYRTCKLEITSKTFILIPTTCLSVPNLLKAKWKVVK